MQKAQIAGRHRAMTVQRVLCVSAEKEGYFCRVRITSSLMRLPSATPAELELGGGRYLRFSGKGRRRVPITGKPTAFASSSIAREFAMKVWRRLQSPETNTPFPSHRRTRWHSRRSPRRSLTYRRSIPLCLGSSSCPLHISFSTRSFAATKEPRERLLQCRYLSRAASVLPPRCDPSRPAKVCVPSSSRSRSDTGER